MISQAFLTIHYFFSTSYELFFSICTIEVLMEGIDSMILARTPNRGKCEKLLTSKQGMDCKVRVC